MDAALIAGLEAGAPTEVLLVSIPALGIYWTDGGFVPWGAETYRESHDTYGVFGGMEPIEDGADSQATVCAITILCDQAALAALIDPALQGSLVTVHFGAVDRETGELLGEPDLLFRGELDTPRLSVGATQALVFDCITEEARMLEPSEEQRLTDSFHRSVWPGELGYSFVTDLEQKVYWRDDDPNNAISRK